MAITSTPSNYSNLCSGRLAAKISTTTSTGITVTADSFRTPAGTGSVTWPTGNQIWKVSRKTRTNTEIEYIGVESLTQTGTAITTGTVIRYLSPTDGTSFATVGDGLSFPAGSVVELIWDVRHAEQTVFKNNANTLTGVNTFGTGGAVRFSGTDTSGLRVKTLTTAERDALTAANGDLIYNSTTGVFNQYITGAWAAIGDAGTANGSETVAGKWEGATVAQQGTSTDAGETGASLVPMNKNLVKTSSGAGDENKIPVLGASGILPIGMLATGTPDGTKFVRDDGTLQDPSSTTIFGSGADSSVVWSSSTNLNPATAYNYTTATLNSGQTLSVSSTNAVLVVKTKGNTTINGTIDLNSQGAAGGAGGASGLNGSVGSNGLSIITPCKTTGGNGGVFSGGNGGGGWSGASHNTTGGTGSLKADANFSAFLANFFRNVSCGSGGGGGGGGTGPTGGAGGAGGGALVWMVGGNLTLGASSIIRANGGSGANGGGGAGPWSGGGGGGGGGTIVIVVAGSITNSGVTVTAAGGAGGLKGGASAGDGGVGAVGDVVIYSLSTGTLIAS